jgi:hypothetical protein
MDKALLAASAVMLFFWRGLHRLNFVYFLHEDESCHVAAGRFAGVVGQGVGEARGGEAFFWIFALYGLKSELVTM